MSYAWNTIWRRVNHRDHSIQENNEKELTDTLLNHTGDCVCVCHIESSYSSQIKLSFRYKVWTALNLLVFCISLALLGLSKSHVTSSDEKEALYQTSFFSPVLNNMNMTMAVKETRGSLFPLKQPGPYRDGLHPNPNINAAWDELEIIRTFPISREDVVQLGKDPELCVKYPPEDGFGSEAYVAQLDIFHQIHCLNMLRQIAWALYGDQVAQGSRYQNKDARHWMHLSHCADILLQNLMCTGNLDVLTFNWMQGQDLPFPDFDVKHKCRDFDAIVAWQRANAVPLGMGRELKRPEGAIQIPAEWLM